MTTAGETMDAGLCALHAETAARSTCARCGNYMCDACSEDGEHEHCPPCRERIGIGSFPLRRDAWSVRQVLDLAWERFKECWGQLAVATLIFYAIIFAVGFVVQLALGAVAMATRGAPLLALTLAIQIGQSAVQGVLQLGLIAMSLDALAGRSVEVGRVFSQVHKVHKVLVQLIVVMIPMMALLFGLGFLFALLSRYDMVLTMIVVIVVLAVPAVYIGLGLLFMQFELVYDDGVGPLEAMRRSWALARGQRGPLLGTAFLAWLVLVGGAFLCLVGLLASIPLAAMMMGVAFLALRNGAGLPDPVRAEP